MATAEHSTGGRVPAEANGRLALFSMATAAATLGLIVVGALVTSTDSGDAVPTWPLSPEGLMPRMVGGVLYEYGHRMVAGLVALLVTVQMLWMRRACVPGWLRTLSQLAFFAVFLQAGLGGLRVLIVANDQVQQAAISASGASVQTLRLAIAIAHACLAQTVLCLVVIIAFFLLQSTVETTTDADFRRLAIVASVVAFGQLLLGALMRHTQAGLAVPDFPLMFGRLLPRLEPLPVNPFIPAGTSVEEYRILVLLHLLHRFAAIAVALVLGALVWRVARADATRRRHAVCLGALLLTQLTLGACIIWTQKSVIMTASHVACGALLLATTVLLAVRLGLAASDRETIARGSAGLRHPLSDYLELAKPRVTMLVIISALPGFILAADSPFPWGLLLRTLIGTTLIVAATNGLNQVMERDADGKMKRTAQRPLPAGRIAAKTASLVLVATAVVGATFLWFLVNPLTSALGLAALANYLFLYTPLKRVTPLCTAIGSISGAIPPMMGWSAARNTLGVEAWTLFAILFIWQFPHFLAIAWMYREDYSNGGFRMLPVIDGDGEMTARQMVLYSVALLPLGLLPTYFGMTGAWYFAGSLLLGLALIRSALQVYANRTKMQARTLLRASVLYLPALLLLMTLDRAPR